MENNIIPIGKNVFIELIEEEAVTASGLYIPENAQPKPSRGKVVAVGMGEYTKDGVLIETVVKTGDIVICKPYGFIDITIGDKKYVVGDEKDLLAIINT